MKPVNRVLVEELLADEALSYREIARQAGCSDWSVRSVAREIDNVQSRDYAESDPLTVRDWGIFGAVVVAIFGGIWLLARRLPPMDGTM